MIWIFLTAVLLLIVYNSDFRNFMIKASKVGLVLSLFLGMIGAMVYYSEEPEEFEYKSPFAKGDSSSVLPEGSKLIEPPLPEGFVLLEETSR